MQERTSLEALIKGKCPCCRQGDMFKYPATKLTKFNIMNQACPHCGVMLEPEPGFYQGAMYVSYGFTVAFIIIITVLLRIIGDFSEWTHILSIIGVMVLLIPLNYRYSRIIYLYLFGGLKYKG